MRKKTVRVELDSANRVAGTLANDAIFNVNWDALFGHGQVARFQVRCDVMVAPENYRYAGDGSFHKGAAWVNCTFPAVNQGSFRGNGAVYNMLTHIQKNCQDDKETNGILQPLMYTYVDNGLILQEYMGRPSGNLRVSFWRYAGSLSPTIVPLRITNVSAELTDMGRWYISLKLDIFYVEDGLPRELLLEPKVMHSRLDLSSADVTFNIANQLNNVQFVRVPWGALIPVGAKRVRCAIDFSTEQYHFSDYLTFFRQAVRADITFPVSTRVTSVESANSAVGSRRISVYSQRCNPWNGAGTTGSEGPSRRWLQKHGNMRNLVELAVVPTGGNIDVAIYGISTSTFEWTAGLRAASSTVLFGNMLNWWVNIHFFSEV